MREFVSAVINSAAKWWLLTVAWIALDVIAGIVT